MGRFDSDAVRMSKDRRYMADYMRQRYERNSEWMRNYKVSVGCKDCGYAEHHAGLEFDHIIPRLGDDSRTVARLMGKSINRIMEEIAKCDVVCRNCHGIRTWNRLKEKRAGSSMVEQLPLKETVEGSSPSQPTQVLL